MICSSSARRTKDVLPANPFPTALEKDLWEKDLGGNGFGIEKDDFRIFKGDPTDLGFSKGLGWGTGEKTDVFSLFP